MEQLDYDFLRAFRVDSLPLVDRQRMIGRFQLDRGPFSDGTLMDVRLEEQRIRVFGDFRAQPAEIRAEARAGRILPMVRHLPIALFAERNPHAPGEGTLGILDGNLQDGPHIKMMLALAVDDALLLTQLALSAIGGRKALPVERRISSERHLINVVNRAATGAVNCILDLSDGTQPASLGTREKWVTSLTSQARTKTRKAARMNQMLFVSRGGLVAIAVDDAPVEANEKGRHGAGEPGHVPGEVSVRLVASLGGEPVVAIGMLMVPAGITPINRPVPTINSGRSNPMPPMNSR